MSKLYDATRIGQQASALGGVHTASGLARLYANMPPGAPVPAGSTAYSSDLGPAMFDGTGWSAIGGVVTSVAGATYDGITDDSAALTNALTKIGSKRAALQISGPMRLAQNVTIPSNIVLTFIGAGMFVPDANVTVTNNAILNAPPGAQIYSIANSGVVYNGQTLTDRFFPYWFGAKNDGTTDCTAAFNACAAAAHAAGDTMIALFSGDHKVSNTIQGNGTSGQTFTGPIWQGSNYRKTRILLTGAGSSTVMFSYTGGSGQLNGSGLRDLTLTGDANTIGAQFNAVCGMRFERVRMESMGVCIQDINGPANTFTEFNVFSACEFNNCLTGAQYSKTSGNDSFHGTGFDNRCVVQVSVDNFVFITIGSGCKVYDAPLDVHIQANGHPCTIIQNNSASPITFIGPRITWEQQNQSSIVTGATGSAVTFGGDLYGTGEAFQAGSLRQAPKGLILSNSGVLDGGGEKSFVGSVDSAGLFMLPSADQQKNRQVYLQLQNSNYDMRFQGTVNHNGYGSNGVYSSAASYPITISTAAGYGSAQVFVNPNGQFGVYFGTAVSFTGNLSIGATSATLSAGFSGTTGTYLMNFANGEIRMVSLTNASTAVTWTGGLLTTSTLGNNVVANATAITFSAALSSGAVSATLGGTWGPATGTYNVSFSNGDKRAVTLTNGATTATWTTPLSSSATTSAAAAKIALTGTNSLQYGLYEKVFDMNNLQNTGLQLQF